jgi:hypothetical protein
VVVKRAESEFSGRREFRIAVMLGEVWFDVVGVLESSSAGAADGILIL